MTSHSDVPQVLRPSVAEPGRAGSGSRFLYAAAMVGYSICGIGATVTPLVLWMTWSETTFVLTLVGCVLSCCGIVLLSKYLPEYRKPERERPDAR
jgi:amino acid permease